MEALFRIFDDDRSGSIDFQEFILALNITKYNKYYDDLSYNVCVLLRITKAEDKLKWIFTVFDK